MFYCVIFLLSVDQKNFVTKVANIVLILNTTWIFTEHQYSCIFPPTIRDCQGNNMYQPGLLYPTFSIPLINSISVYFSNKVVQLIPLNIRAEIESTFHFQWFLRMNKNKLGWAGPSSSTCRLGQAIASSQVPIFFHFDHNWGLFDTFWTLRSNY